MNKKKIILLGLDILFLAILILIDQVTKYFAVTHLKDSSAFPIWEGVFELNYLENRGAAFGMLQNQKVFFIFITAIILLVIAYVLVKAPTQNKYVKLHFALILVAGGGIGNMIDRIRLDYVVDFLKFTLINFPTFNVADIYITLASIFLVILILFVYKESDLEFLSFRTKKFREVK